MSIQLYIEDEAVPPTSAVECRLCKFDHLNFNYTQKILIPVLLICSFRDSLTHLNRSCISLRLSSEFLSDSYYL